MEAIRQYIFSICVCAVLCGIILGMFRKGMFYDLLKFFCGLLLTFTVVSPLADLNRLDFRDFHISATQDAAQASAMGEKMAEDVLRDIIKSRIEAYILDKAASLNISIEAEVELSDTDLPVPKTIRIEGSASPYAKQQLERFLADHLGVSKENIRWIG